MWKPVNALPCAFGLWIYGIYLIYTAGLHFFYADHKDNGDIWVRRQIDTGNNDR